MFLKTANAALVLALFIFLLAPVIMVFPLSFSGDNFISWPPSSWSGRWYEAMTQQPNLTAAFRNSLTLAAITTVLALVIGMMVAFVVVRFPFFGRDAVTGFFTLPLVLPSIVVGLAMLILFSERGWIGSWTGLLIAHVTITLPFTIRILSTSLTTLPADIEAAAASLGASPMRVIRHVTLPLMMPGVIAAGALAFLLSFDEAVISLFIVGPRLSTLPVELYRMIQERNDPLPAAISVVLILATLLFIVLIERLVGLRRAVATG